MQTQSQGAGGKWRMVKWGLYLETKSGPMSACEERARSHPKGLKGLLQDNPYGKEAGIQGVGRASAWAAQQHGQVQEPTDNPWRFSPYFLCLALSL